MPSPSSVEAAALDLPAQEVWPEDAQLFQPYEAEQILLPDNANCLAIKTYLRICNLPFKVEMRRNAEFMSPTGKVPFLRCGAFLLGDFDSIIQHVTERGITTGLTKAEQAEMRTYMCTVNNVFHNAELYICWVEESTYNNVTKLRYGSVFSWPLNIFQTRLKRNQVVKTLKKFRWYEKTIDEVLAEVDRCFSALSDKLNGNDYFFGKPTELDALVFGHIFLIMTTPLPFRKLAEIVQKYKDLIEHTRRMDAFFKEKP